MRITLYTFSKKPNSTARPENGITFDCEIYDPCSIIAPTLILHGDPTSYNYAYIPKWSRYYFVDNWRYDGSRWIGSLSVDVLATYKDDIGASSQYVVRSSSKSNPGVQDTLYPCVATPVYSRVERPAPWESENGCYVVGVMGGKTSFYAMTPGQLNILMSYIFSDAYADEVIGGLYADIYPELKAQLNPLQYISSVVWYPITFTGYSTSLTVGWVDTPASGDRIPEDSIGVRDVTYTIPRHPQGGKGSYLSMAPYSEYHLYYPPFGCISLDSNLVAEADEILAKLYLDPRTSEAILIISDGVNQASRVTSKIGSPVQLGQITAPGFGLGSTIQAGSQLLSGLAGSAAGFLEATPSAILSSVSGLANTVSNTVGAIGDMAAGQIPSINTIGSPVGGIASITGITSLVGRFLPVTSKDNANKGTPLMQVENIGSLGGYCVVSDPHLSTSALPDEITVLYRYMTGGFYYE